MSSKIRNQTISRRRFWALFGVRFWEYQRKVFKPKSRTNFNMHRHFDPYKTRKATIFGLTSTNESIFRRCFVWKGKGYFTVERLLGRSQNSDGRWCTLDRRRNFKSRICSCKITLARKTRQGNSLTKKIPSLFFGDQDFAFIITSKSVRIPDLSPSSKIFFQINLKFSNFRICSHLPKFCEERMWEVQRIKTALKRKQKQLRKDKENQDRKEQEEMEQLLNEEKRAIIEQEELLRLFYYIFKSLSLD